jgi:hypothetical protein
MVFTVQELRDDWHDIGQPVARRGEEAVAHSAKRSGLFRVKALGERIWDYFWVNRGGRLEAMDR